MREHACGYCADCGVLDVIWRIRIHVEHFVFVLNLCDSCEVRLQKAIGLQP